MLAAAGLIHAKGQGKGVMRRYNDIVFERFWKRELDIEDPAVVADVLAEAGAERAAAAAYLAGPGREEAAHISREAEDKGVFGVPSFLLDGELFWGSEHLPAIRDMLRTAIGETA
jgi:2-hydroxychromene-2-carboxylate isomerase